MAEDFIDIIYEKAYITTKFRMMTDFCRMGRYDSTQTMWNSSIEKIAEICRETAEMHLELGVQLWDYCQTISKCLQEREYVKAADALENSIDFLYSSVELNGNIDVTDDNYRLFSSKSGFLNIQDINNNEIYYSEIDPVWEQRKLAESLYNPKMKKIFILGCGLGYLPWQIFEVANQSIDIYIYENDAKMIEYAKMYGALDRIPEERIFIILEEDNNKLLDKYSDSFHLYKDESAALYVSNYFISKLNSKQIEALDELISMIYTSFEFNDIVQQNFYRNHSNVKRDIGEIDFKSTPKEWIIVAGGPSLDKNIDYIKQQCKKKTIVCVTTSYKRLLNEGIKADYMVVMDPQNRTYGHLEGIDNYETKLIIADTANWQFGEKYKGKKYLVNISGKYYSIDYEGKKWYSQGTVTGFAIDVAVYAGAESIELIGVDLAYPTLFSHAEGTMDNAKVDIENMEKVPSVNGGKVYTSPVFKSYISDIEYQIQQNRNIKFYNLSKDGALIKGCKKFES